MAVRNLLYQREYKINDNIRVAIPCVRDVIADENGYDELVSVWTAMPIDMMVQLDDAGIDFTKINEYELFLLLFPSIRNMDTRRVLCDIDLKKFDVVMNQTGDSLILKNSENGVVIDRSIHARIAATLRKINHLEKNNKKPGNDEARQYMIDRARKKIARSKRREQDSQTESLIISLVNTAEFKYDFDETLDLTIYQLKESAYQIIKKIDYDNRMFGIYTGNINPKDIKKDDLTWLAK